MLPYIIKSVRQLENAGADFIVMPCNTLHELLPKLRKLFKIRFVDLIEEASKKISGNYKKIGVLCTNKTRKERLYDSILKNIEVIYPNEFEQEKVSEIIVKIIRGKQTIEDKIYLKRLINRLVENGAEKVLLACTDLINLIGNNEYTLDTTQILIDSTIMEMFKE